MSSPPSTDHEKESDDSEEYEVSDDDDDPTMNEDKIFSELKENVRHILHHLSFNHFTKFDKFIALMQKFVSTEVVDFLRRNSKNQSKDFINKLKNLSPHLSVRPCLNSVQFKLENLDLEDWFMVVVEFHDKSKLEYCEKAILRDRKLIQNQELDDLLKTVRYIDDIPEDNFKGYLTTKDFIAKLPLFRTRNLEKVKKDMENSDNAHEMEPELSKLLEDGRKLQQIAEHLKKERQMLTEKRVSKLVTLQEQENWRRENEETRLEEDVEEPANKKRRSENVEESERHREERMRAEERIHKLMMIIKSKEEKLNKKRREIQKEQEDNDWSEYLNLVSLAEAVKYERKIEDIGGLQKSKMVELEQQHKAKIKEQEKEIDELKEQIRTLEIKHFCYTF